MSNYQETKDALKNFLQSLSTLRDLKVITNKKDFTCQIGEWLVAELYEGQRAISGNQKDWDLEVNGKYIQVKAHSKAETNKSRFSSINYHKNATIDELITVVFSPDYKLNEFYKIPWIEAEKLIKKTKKGFKITWKRQQKAGYKMDIDSLPKQDFIALFK